MPVFAEENLVMWRGYAHLVSLMDLLRLRTAGWVIESLDRPDVHLGVVHAIQEYDTPEDAARHLDVQAALARQERETMRPRRRGEDVWVHADPPAPGREPRDRASHRTQTARARRASRRAGRRLA